MATDSMNLPQGETTLDASIDMAVSDLDLTTVQMAQTEPATYVDLPKGNTVILIPVQPGQTVRLPTDSTDGLLAKIGPEGNLAIVVDGRTIILQGFLKANDQTPIKIVTNDGDAVNVADVIAKTDPSLDIQTAAGPASGDQGDTEGSGIYVPFLAGPGLGGLDALGILDPTALQYRLIDDEFEEFTLDEEDGGPTDIEITFDILGGVVNEDDLRGPINFPPDEFPIQKLVLSDAGINGVGNDPFDTGDREGGSKAFPPDDGDTVDNNGTGVDDDREPLETVATVKVDFHGDVPGTLEVDLSKLPADLTSQGEPIVYQLDPAQAGVHGNGIFAYVETGGGAGYQDGLDRLVFEVHVDKDKSDGEFKVTFTLHDNLDNEAPDSLIGADEQTLDLPVKFKITDSDGSFVFGELPLGVQDDIPFFGEVQGDPYIDLTIVERTGPHVTNDESLLPLEGDDQSIFDPDVQSLLLDLDAKINAAGFSVPTLLESLGTLTVPNAAQTQVKLSFGADFPTEFSKVAGDDSRDSVFGALKDKEGDGVVDGKDGNGDFTENEHPYELFMVQNKHAADLTDADLTIDDQETKNTVTWNGELKTIFLHQIDAHTIVGYIDVGPGEAAKSSFDIESNQEAVLVINIDDDGLLTLVQLHQVNNPLPGPGGGDPDLHDEPLQIVGADGTPLVYVRGTDSDGDHAISPINIQIQDDGPCFIHVIGTHNVDEDTIDLSKGNPGGPGDDGVFVPNFAVGAVFFSIGEDRPGNIDIASLKITDHNSVEIPLASLKTADDQPVIIDTSDPNRWVGHAGTIAGPEVFVFELDTTLEPIGTVGYKFTLLAPLEHSLEDDPSTKGTETSFEDDLHFDFTVKATDVDGDWAEGVVAITIDDDSPFVTKNIIESFRLGVDETVRETKNGGGSYIDIDAAGSGDKDGPTIENDEIVNAGVVAAAGLKTDGVIGAGTENTADLFVARPGADGGTVVYSLSFVLGDSGLTETISDEPINLVAGPDGGIEGRTAGSNQLVFAIAIDPDTGLVTTAQYLPIIHANGGNPDEIAKMAGNKISVTVTVTDNDGDTVSSTRDIGDGFRFEDDGPTAPTFAANSVDVVHDETAGLQNGGAGDLDGDDVLGTSIAFGATMVASLFSGLVGTGDDPHVADNPIGYARSGSSLVTQVGGSGGSDGEASRSHALVVSNGTASGVSTTEGTQIFLYQVSAALVVGRVGTEGAPDTANAAGTIAFAIAIDPASGEVFTVQYLSLQHPTFPDNFDEPVSLTDGAVQVTVTITDGDGDKAASLGENIGNQIVFEDDGPTAPTFAANSVDVVHDETAGLQNGGAGDLDGDDVLGTSIAFGATMVASLFSGLVGTGDDPHVADNPIGYARSGSSLVTQVGGSGGSDGEASRSHALVVSNGTASGVSTTEGTQIFLYQVSAALVVGRVGTEGAPDTANAAGTIAFAIAIDPASGEVFTVQYLSLQHPTFPDNFDEPVSLTDGAVQVTVTITDGDGDKAASLGENIGNQIVFEDDGPKVDLVKIEIEDEGSEEGDGNLILDETKGNDAGSDDTTGPLAVFSALETDNSLTAIQYAETVVDVDLSDGKGNPNAAYGSDGPGTTELSLTKSGGEAFTGQQTNLHDTATGESIFLFTEGDIVVGRHGADATAAATGEISFALSLSNTGTLSLAEYHAIQHPIFPNDFDEPVTLLASDGKSALVNITALVTDGDGDQVTVSLALDGKNGDNGIIFEDDGPSGKLSIKIGGENEDNLLVQDETAGVQNHPTQDSDPDQSKEDEDDVAARPSAFDDFEDVDHAGIQPIGYASTTVAILDGGSPITDAVYGSDVPGSTKIALTDADGKAFDGDVTNLVDTLTGTSIFLFAEGDLVVGRVGNGTDIDGKPTGGISFAISIDADALDLAQYRAIKHPDTTSDDDSIALLNGVAGTNQLGLVFATVTVTDGDGDSVTKSIPFDGLEGNPAIIFQDDGPTAVADTDSVSEGGPTVATGDVYTGVDGGYDGTTDENGEDGNADSPGTDGLKSLTWKDSGIDGDDEGGSDGIDEDGQIQGLYGTLFVDDDGNYKYVLDETKQAVKDLNSGDTLKDVFDYTLTDKDADTDSTTLTITINGKNSPPDTHVRIGAEVGTDTICVPEDSDGVAIPIVASTTAGSHLTTIVISGFPTTALTDGWTINLSDLDDANTDFVSTIGTDGKVTITFTDLVSTNFSSSITVSPPDDSDVDLGTLTASVHAVNNTDSQTDDDSDQAFVRVDAIADGDDKGDDGDSDVFGVTIAVSESNPDGNTSFQNGEVGNLKVTASYDDFKDGSETHALVVDAPAGFTFNLLSLGTIPAGVVLDGASTTTHLIFEVDSKDGDGQNGVSDLELNIPVTYGGGQPDGSSGNFKATVTTTETPTDLECDLTNNTDSAETTTKATIAGTPTTDIRIGTEGNTDVVCVPEDSPGVDVPVVASTTAGSHLTTIVISGFPIGGGGFTIVPTGLDLANTTVSNTINVDGKITITFDDAVSTAFNGSFKVTPAGDSDVDLGTLTAVVNAVSNTDANVKDDDTDKAFVRVDAIADGTGPGFGDDGDPSVLSVSIVAADSGDAGDKFSTGEKGTLTLGATFDDFHDGSEAHQVVIDAPAGFQFTGTIAGLPAGVVKDAASTSTHLIFNVDSKDGDGQNGVGTFSGVQIEIQNVSAPSGTTANFTATASAVESPTDQECDTTNNSQSVGATAQVQTLNNVPDANPDTNSVAQGTNTNYQLMLVIDISGSMGQTVTKPDGTTTTRMELQKVAVIALLQSYVASTSGTVNVKMVNFSDSASFFGGTNATTFRNASNPADLTALITAINALSPTNRTDYDTALATAQTGIMDASWVTTSATTKGLVYFFSDGRPVDDGDGSSPYTGGDAANQVNDAEENLWEGRTNGDATFPSGLADKGVVSIAVGLGSDIANDSTALAQLGRVAYYNETFQDNSVIVVNDENQLVNEIIQTVPSAVTGNVLTNDTGGPDGYGSPKITGIVGIIDADTTSAVVTPIGTTFKVETNNGVLIIDKITGDYTYTAKPLSGGNTDTFTYTIQDAIGPDTDSSTLTINIVSPINVSGIGLFTGTAVSEFIIGDDANNNIKGGDGNDNIRGGYGNDTLEGEGGDDSILGQEGNDNVTGGAGNDNLFGGNGNDTLDGGADNDLVDGGTGDDNVTGGTGNDTVRGAIGNDTVDGGAGNDSVTGGQGNDALKGGSDDDTYFFVLGDGTDTIIDTSGNDKIVINGGGSGVNAMQASRSGNDLIIQYGNTTANNQITITGHYAGTGNVETLQIIGGSFAGIYGISTDITTPLDGAGGNDFIAGSTGAETLNGNGGIDLLFGGGGDDIINGGTGADRMIGGDGNDTFTVDDGGDLVFESSGGSSGSADLVNSSVAFSLGDNVENLTLTGVSGVNGTGNASDNIITGNTGTNTLDGGDGNDTLDGGNDAVADILNGGNGDDVLIWRGSADTYNGGSESSSNLLSATNHGDVLNVSGVASVDFTSIGDATIEDVETIRTTGGGVNTITLNASDVINDFEGGTINPSGSGWGSAPALVIERDATDVVNLTGGGWFDASANGAGSVPPGYTLFVHVLSGAVPNVNEDAYVLIQGTSASVNLS